ncbi:hypothetical protein QUA54_25725 [Microcoleus sp. MOSTC5]|uniref:hypothetical protein n=1 Tax=Microcoleus sp. MOSTC5 TaxID=3055378 RepID=UPI002FD16084
MAGWNSTSWEDKVDNPEFENLEKSRKPARQGDREDKEDSQQSAVSIQQSTVNT